MTQLPFLPAQADKVYDGVARGAPSWVHDGAVDPAGRPVVVYATFRPPLTTGTVTRAGTG